MGESRKFMQETIKTVAPSLRALLEGFIDYAGLYPPAKVPLDQAMKNYESYRSGQYAWMLRWLKLKDALISSVHENLSRLMFFSAMRTLLV